MSSLLKKHIGLTIKFELFGSAELSSISIKHSGSVYLISFERGRGIQKALAKKLWFKPL